MTALLEAPSNSLLAIKSQTQYQTTTPTIATASPDVQLMLESLSPLDLETAARTSYRYLKHPTPQLRDFYAIRLCQRYLESKKDVSLALDKMRKTLKFRREMDLDGIMTLFDHDMHDSKDHPVASHLERRLAHQKCHVQGYDKQGRSTLLFVPRNTKDFDQEWDLKEALYTMERAIACSNAEDGTINAVVDFSGFSILRQSPPLSYGKTFLSTLRSHYAGQIHKIYLLDCPPSFSMLWTLFSPFIGTSTREKIQFLDGNDKEQLKEHYELDQMPSWMCPGGTHDVPMDLPKYLYELPFDECL
eukprot:Nitzschia sp. Nitz4//scaffold172_size47551//21306//22211//NITZ4_007143-RA/size47551-processed-gene-0.16-mRNA-1//1//CDS//3329538756//2470//frame0